MKKVIFFLIFFNLSFTLDLPVEPNLPQVDEEFSTEIPKIEDPFLDLKTNSLIYFVKTKLYLKNGNIKERILIFSNVNLISFTNEQGNIKKIYSFSLYQIEKLEIFKWKAILLSNNLYLFTPDYYKIYLKNEGSNIIEVNGNISYFNSLVSKTDEKYENFYTIFYDYWISGKNKFFRWRNSRSMVFEYNLVNPLPDVVVKIEFLW